jgi:hypothetical protein
MISDLYAIHRTNTPSPYCQSWVRSVQLSTAKELEMMRKLGIIA